MKTAQDFLKEANEIVKKIDPLDAIQKHGSDETIFIDVRDSGDIQKQELLRMRLQFQEDLLNLLQMTRHPISIQN